jgi:hypothetical protein
VRIEVIPTFLDDAYQWRTLVTKPEIKTTINRSTTANSTTNNKQQNIIPSYLLEVIQAKRANYFCENKSKKKNTHTHTHELFTTGQL